MKSELRILKYIDVQCKLQMFPIYRIFRAKLSANKKPEKIRLYFLSGNISSDNKFLNFRSSFAYRTKLGISVVFLCREVFGVTITSKDLYSFICYFTQASEAYSLAIAPSRVIFVYCFSNKQHAESIILMHQFQ